MVDRYKNRFALLKSEQKKAFMPYTILGWPSRELSLAMIRQMIESGVSALELGIAFSDPIADGPVIQEASTATLATGFGVNDALSLLSEIRQIDANIPIGLLVYFNMVVARGIDQFFKQAKEAGVDGILMADLPAENAEEIISPARAHGIAPIFLVSPLTSEARLETILQVAGGFIYFVSRLGVTGVQSRAADADAHLSEKFATIKQKSDLPVCAGFGIAEPSDARLMFQMGADGVIAGSKVIQLAESGLTSLNFSALAHYYKEMLAVADYHKSTQTAFDKS